MGLKALLCCAGGAAGLTLTAAQAVFLMEPAINPGLEAQAAARIHRLGRVPISSFRIVVSTLYSEGLREQIACFVDTSYPNELCLCACVQEGFQCAI